MRRTGALGDFDRWRTPTMMLACAGLVLRPFFAVLVDPDGCLALPPLYRERPME